MKRSGGRAGRPFAHLSILEIEARVRLSEHDPLELTAILAELGYRTTKRAKELRELVIRLLGDLRPKAIKSAGPMFQ
jgi:hypothetical protein